MTISTAALDAAIAEGRAAFEKFATGWIEVGRLLCWIRARGDLDDDVLSGIGIGRIEAEHAMRLAERVLAEHGQGRGMQEILEGLRCDETLNPFLHFTLCRLEKKP